MPKKSEYLFISKSDMITPEELKKKITALKKSSVNHGKKIITISIHDIDSLEKVKSILNKIQQDK